MNYPAGNSMVVINKDEMAFMQDPSTSRLQAGGMKLFYLA
jgi:hypothetical protein